MHCTTPGFRTALALLLGAVCGAASAMERSHNDCPAVLPADAVAISQPWLCQKGDAGENNPAVCQEYSDDHKLYQLVFRGGTVPYAVHEISTTGGTVPAAVVMDDSPRRAGKPQCDLERPAGVPAKAVYRGTGVCEDQQGQPLPCSLFEHAGARDPEAKRYFVYYDPNGRGVRQIDTVSAGRNVHVLEAELAYQLGQALAATGCCRDRAREYAAHAADLFPDDSTYHTALQEPMVPVTQQASTVPDCAPGSTASMNPSQQ